MATLCVVMFRAMPSRMATNNVAMPPLDKRLPQETIMADDEQDEKDEGPDEEQVAEESAPRRCPHCKATLGEDADVCPRCHKDPTEPAGKKWFATIVLIFIAAMLVLGIWAVFFAPQSPTPTKTPTTVNTQNAS